ncbi:LytR C-terminal domain-containing protein [Candidatus Woesebacteria bacterium]|nr:LytR C-terminal domain-containing protein [Candidatus Woesebacteria bacterium]
MLNSKKILFILSDIAYIAELLPDKKPLSFSIQSCTQINGNFIQGTTINAGNVSKLFNKLDSGESYQIILPDNLFTNDILTIEETGDVKIKDALKKVSLPALKISQETHDISTTVLNELRGTTRVQLSAIEKGLLAPLRAIATNTQIEIENIAPLSWSLKSIVSLEPSVVILQLGSILYGSLHYIGVEQCFSEPTEDLEKIVAKIQLLKKNEPSIMTCYLITNDLVESGLKTGLKQILPVQQMTEQTKDQEKLPAAVATIIEESLRTLSIPDYPVPRFLLSKPSADEVKTYAAALTEAEKEADETPDIEPNVAVTKKDGATTDQVLPKPHVLPTTTPSTAETLTTESEPAATSPVTTDEKTDVTITEAKPEEKIELETITEPKPPAIVNSDQPTKEEKHTMTENNSGTAEPAIDLRQFAGAQSTIITTKEPIKPGKIKNKARSMTKMIMITLLVFVGTVALGIGVGMLVLKYTSKPAVTTPVIEVQATPTPAMTDDTAEDASSSAASDSGKLNGADSATVSATMAQQKILVVNATTKAGYAGKIKDLLTDAGYKNVTAGNAKGTYTTEDDFIFQKKENAELLSSLNKMSKLVFSSDDTAKQEDASGAYDAVIVLNK